MRIICPCCGAEPPVARWADEDYVAYGHRKWRWVANHIVSDHARREAMTHRHRIALKKGDAKASETKFAGKRANAA